MSSPPKRYEHFIGLICGAAAGFVYALANSLVQYIYRHSTEIKLPQFQIIFVTSALQTILISIILAWNKLNPLEGSKKNFTSLMLMGLTKIICIILFYYALKYIPLGDATVILFTAPVFTVFLGNCILKERFSIFNVLFALVSFLGVTIIASPGLFFPSKARKTPTALYHSLLQKENSTSTHLLHAVENAKGISFSLAAALVVSFHVIFLRYTTMSIDFRITVLYPSIFGVLIPPIAMGILGQRFLLDELSTTHWLIMLTVGCVHFCGTVLVAMALKLEDAGPVAITKNTEVASALAFEALIEKETPMKFTIIGAFLIVLGTLMIMLNRLYSLERRIFQKCCHKTIDKEDGRDDIEENTPMLDTT